MRKCVWLAAAVAGVAAFARAGREVRPVATAARPPPEVPVVEPSSPPSEAPPLEALHDEVRRLRDVRGEAGVVHAQCASRAAVIGPLLDDDRAANEFLDVVLAEPDADLRLALARLLRPASHRVRSRLIALARRDMPEDLRAVAVAASRAHDRELRVRLEAASRDEPSEQLRALAVESLGAGPATDTTDAALRFAIERDPAPAVRRAAVEAYATGQVAGPELGAYFIARLRLEPDAAVRASLEGLMPEAPKPE
jgi:hypothetical protein